MSSARRYVAFLGAAALVLAICCCLLPRLAQSPYLEVVQCNLRNDVEVTAYFYTDIDDFSQYERALRKTPGRAHRPFAETEDKPQARD